MEDHYEVFFGYVSKKSITTIQQESMYFDASVCKRHVKTAILRAEHRTGGSTEEERRRREQVFMEYHGCSSLICTESLCCARDSGTETMYTSCTCTCIVLVPDSRTAPIDVKAMYR